MSGPFYKFKQNNIEMIRLLQASTVAYNNAKSNEFIFTYVLFFLAVAYPVMYIFLKNVSVQPFYITGFFVNVMTLLLIDTFRGNTSKGALMKEQFDTTLFNLPWKFLLPRPDPVEVIRLAKQYKGRQVDNWYSPNISEAIPENTVIAICQRINSGWDIELRARYKTFLVAMLTCYTGLIFIIWVLKSVQGNTIFIVYYSTLSFYIHILTLIRGNTNAIRRRRAVVTILDEFINNKREVRRDYLREIQDEIFQIRQEPAKVPDTVFKMYDKRLREEFEEYILQVNKVYE